MSNHSTGAREQSRVRRMVERSVLVPEISLVLAIIVFGVIVAVRSEHFLQFTNLTLVLKATAPLFIVAITMTFVIIGGGLDLSVGSMATLGGVTTASLLQGGAGVVPSILGGLVLCALTGALNGVLVAYANINPLIVTLGAMYVIQGVVLVYTQGIQIFPLPDEFKVIAQGNVAGLPNLVIYGVIAGVVGHLVLQRSVYGYRVRAVGGNADAARSSGINTRRTTLSLYILSGVGAGVAGVLLSSQVGIGDPSANQGMALSVIAAVIVGGASLFGAIGSMGGTALGVLLLALIANGLLLMSVSPYYQFVVQGVVVVGAVGIDQIRRTQFWKSAAR